jgi:hypothetical protein
MQCIVLRYSILQILAHESNMFRSLMGSSSVIRIKVKSIPDDPTKDRNMLDSFARICNIEYLRTIHCILLDWILFDLIAFFRLSLREPVD